MTFKKTAKGVSLLLIAFIAAACTGPSAPAESAPFPNAGVSHTLYFADVLGGKKPEIVAASDSAVSVFGLNGKLLVRRVLRHDRYRPAFLCDFDGDSKADIVLGTIHAPNAELIIIDGRGNVKFNLIQKKAAAGYGSFMPQFELNGAFYVTAGEGWVYLPRGLIKYKIPSFRQEWFFHVPSDPTGVTIQYDTTDKAVMTVSHRTLVNDSMPFIGKDKRFTGGWDAGVNLYQCDEDGNIINLVRLNNPATGRQLQGKGRFIPLGTEVGSPILLVQEIIEEPGYAEPMGRLFFIEANPSGGSENTGPGITMTSDILSGEITDIEIIHDDVETSEIGGRSVSGEIIIALIQKTGDAAWRYSIFDESLQIQTSWDFNAETCLFSRESAKPSSGGTPASPRYLVCGADVFTINNTGAIDFKGQAGGTVTASVTGRFKDKAYLVLAHERVEVWESKVPPFQTPPIPLQ